MTEQLNGGYIDAVAHQRPYGSPGGNCEYCVHARFSLQVLITFVVEFQHMFNHLGNTAKGILFAMMGFSAYTVADACVKWLSTYYPIIEIVALTYCFSLIFCMIVSPWLGGLKRTVQTKRLKIHIARGFTNIGVAVCAILALSHMPIT